MAESATLAAEDPAGNRRPGSDRNPASDRDRRRGRRSDGGSPLVGYLGDFSRGPAVFTVYRIGPDQSRYPNGPTEFLVDCDDGVGPHEVCRFSDEAADGQNTEGRDFAVVWRGAWNGDEWCDWIMEHVRAFVADRSSR